MNNVFEFPKNNHYLITKARQDIERNNIKEAYKTLIEVYEQTDHPDIEMLEMLAYSAIQLREYEVSRQCLENYRSQVMNNATLTNYYLETLICCDEKELALLIAKEQKPKFPTNTHIQRIIEELQEMNERKEDIEKEAIKRRLHALSSMTHAEQMTTIMQAEVLNKTELEELEDSVLKNPYIGAVVRTTFLQILLSKGLKKDTTLLWYGELRTLSLDEIVPFEANQFINEIITQLHQRLLDHPVQFEMVKNEVIFHLMRIYPFEQDVIEDKTEWIDFYIKKFVDHKQLDVVTERQNRQKKWFEKLINEI